MSDYKNPKEGETYISPRLKDFDEPERKVRIASKVIVSPDSYAFAKIKDEVVLRHKENAKSHITAKFLEDNRGIFVLSIQGYSVAADKPHNASFSFVGKEIGKLLEFVRNIQSVNLDSPSPVNVSDDELNRIVLSDKQAKSLLHENLALFSEVLRSEVTTEDLVAVGYRKKQLGVYEKLLNDTDYFASLKEKKKCTTESLWQQYYEKNSWIFGYGLGYIFLSGLNDKKLEQVVQGHSVDNHGKRVDALMKTRGVISNLCFVEIKTHITELLESKPYRSGCWAPSRELVGAIAQVQGTVAAAVANLSGKLNPTDKEGNPTGEEIFNYQPKSYLVIGSMEQFVTDSGVNQDKLRSFELLRKNTTNPEVITFDELYQRAKYIVHQNQVS